MFEPRASPTARWRRWSESRHLVVDLGPPVLLGLAALTAVELGRAGDAAATVVFVAAPLVVRRAWPFAVLVIVLAGTVLTGGRGQWIDIAAVAVASFTTGEVARERWFAALGVVLVASATAFGFLIQGAEPFASIVVPFVIMVPSWVVGDAIRGRRLDAARRAEASARVEQDRTTRLEAAVADERRQMARELHDVVAHGVSVMLIQAGAARQVVHTSPERAEAALLAIEATGREAMAELRRLLGVLGDDGETATLAPTPGVGQLGSLVERVRLAGLAAELAVDGPARPLPALLDMTVYRIAQEALTNALRYAQQARTLVHLSYGVAQVQLEILDDGPALADPDADGTGRGLMGMRERAAQVGGRLEAGPRLGGGYAVRAWLPFEVDRA
jgi:signal transduction histidine kinase